MTADARSGRNAIIGVALALSVSAFSIHYYTQGLFLGPMLRDLGWTAEAYMSGILISGLAAAAATPGIGYLVDRFGARRAALASVAVFALGTGLLALIGASLPVYFLLMGMLGLACIAHGPLAYGKLIVGWFDRGRGLALAVAFSGTAIGGVLIPPLAAWLIEELGWRGARASLAVLVALVALPALLFLVREPPAAMPRSSDQAPAAGLSLGQASRTRDFWLLLAAITLAGIPLNGLLVHLVPILTSKGLSPLLAASVLSGIALAQIAGRLTSGALVDRFLSAKVGGGVLGLATLGVLLVLNGPGVAVVIFGCVLIGLAFGAELEMTSIFASRLFGLRHYGTISGVMLTFHLVGAACGPLALQLLVSHGDYGRPLLAAACALALAAAALLAIGPYRFLPDEETSAGERTSLTGE